MLAFGYEQIIGDRFEAQLVDRQADLFKCLADAALLRRFAELEMKVVLGEVLATARLRAVGKSQEGLKRKRFTFAPEGGAAAEVETLVSPKSSLGTRRFRRRVPQVMTPHA